MSELRRCTGEVVERVRCGESLVVTRWGKPVAKLRPIGALAVDRDTLSSRWRSIPVVDPTRLQADVDQLFS